MMQTRKGATRVADVPPDILAGLAAGQIEAATLAENLAIDFGELLANALPELSDEAVRVDAKAGITKRMAAVAAIIIEKYGDEKLEFLAMHRSDLVRGWGAYVLAGLPNMPLQERMLRMLPLANDPHFGVREWSWLALRSHIVEQPLEAVALLRPWVSDDSENIRRFAVEATRPRGVWSAHIAELKRDPEKARSLLSPVRSDVSKYVRDSVANWLNDAWKSRSDWVEQLCVEWEFASPTEQTRYIIKRALRSKK